MSPAMCYGHSYNCTTIINVWYSTLVERVVKRIAHMLTPDQFRVNEVWIAIRVNESFLFVKDEPYDIYVLIDAASAYVLGHVFSRVVDEAPLESDVEDLFKQAWGSKNQWAEQLIVAENSKAADVFRTQAEKIGLSLRIVSLSELEPIVGPLKESFASDFMENVT